MMSKNKKKPLLQPPKAHHSWSPGPGLRYALLALLLGCNAGATLDSAAGAVDDAEVRTLSRPEAGATAAEYHARRATLRLFGVQGLEPGMTPDQVTATIADTATWATRDYHVGDVVARNLVVRAIDEGSVTLGASPTPPSTPGSAATAPAGSTLKLTVGGDVTVRLIDHDFDQAVTYQGAHRYVVRTEALRRLRAAHGLGASGEIVTLGDTQVLRLTAVARDSALARLGFQDGDRIYEVDGHLPQPADLSAMVDQLGQPGATRGQTAAPASSVVIVAGRGHSVWEAHYDLR